MVFLAAVAFATLAQPAQKVSAACTPATDYGTVTNTVSVPASTTYRVWSRIMAPDTTNNSFAIEIDGGSCINVGGASSIPANTWTWVDYKDGATATKIDVALTAGNHTIKLIGIEPSVSVDRVILTSDTTCVPTGTGDNCANPGDTTDPTTSVTAPTNNATVNGTVNISATASDDTGVTKVEFYINGQLIGTDTTSAYGFSWNTTTSPNGSYQLTTKAYDAAGNVGTSAVVNVTVNNDLTSPTVSIAAPVGGSTISGTAVAFTANASDNVGITKVELSVDGTIVATDTTTPYTTTVNTSSMTNGLHTLSAKAYDAAGNVSNASISVTVNNADTTAPTVSVTSPINGSTVSGTINFSANAYDNVSLTKVEFLIDNNIVATDTSSAYTTSVDTTSLTNGSHTFLAKVYDAAGNTKTAAVTVTVSNTTATPPQGDTNNDARVDIRDLATVIANFGKTGATLTQGDVSGNGTVDIQDIAIVIARFTP